MSGTQENLFDARKFKELVVYVCQKTEDDPTFGKTKLLKLLAYSDFLSFRRTGNSITGASYLKLEFGPGPKELPDTLEVLEAKDDIRVTTQNTYGYQQKRYLANREADLSVFADGEVETADEIIGRFWGWSNSDMSDKSHHDFAGWALLREMDTIPYESVFLTTYASERDVERGRELAAANAW